MIMKLSNTMKLMNDVNIVTEIPIKREFSVKKQIIYPLCYNTKLLEISINTLDTNEYSPIEIKYLLNEDVYIFYSFYKYFLQIIKDLNDENIYYSMDYDKDDNKFFLRFK